MYRNIGTFAFTKSSEYSINSNIPRKLSAFNNFMNTLKNDVDSKLFGTASLYRTVKYENYSKGKIHTLKSPWTYPRTFDLAIPPLAFLLLSVRWKPNWTFQFLHCAHLFRDWANTNYWDARSETLYRAVILNSLFSWCISHVIKEYLKKDDESGYSCLTFGSLCASLERSNAGSGSGYGISRCNQWTFSKCNCFFRYRRQHCLIYEAPSVVNQVWYVQQVWIEAIVSN